MRGEDKKKLFNLIEELYEKPYSYILIDCHPGGSKVAIQTNILMKEFPTIGIVYEKKGIKLH